MYFIYKVHKYICTYIDTIIWNKQKTENNFGLASSQARYHINIKLPQPLFSFRQYVTYVTTRWRYMYTADPYYSENYAVP